MLRDTRPLNADTPKNLHHEKPPKFIVSSVTSL
jgi:hypothetical protein